MALIVLVEALCVEEIDVGYSCMGDLDTDILGSFDFGCGYVHGFEICEILWANQLLVDLRLL